MSNPKTPDVFTVFPLLPCELRLKIYSFINHQPRTVTLASEKVLDRGVHSRCGECSVERRWVSPSYVPPMLHVSREARFEALQVYSLAFGTPSRPGTTYFNFEIDTLRFGNAAYVDFRGEPQKNYTMGRLWTDPFPHAWTGSFDRNSIEVKDQYGIEGRTIPTFAKFNTEVKDAREVQQLELDIHLNSSTPSSLYINLIAAVSGLRSLKKLTLVALSDGGEEIALRNLMKTGELLMQTYKPRRHLHFTIPETDVVVMHSGQVWGSFGVYPDGPRFVDHQESVGEAVITV